jgi:PAS domain-containing protein
MQRSQLQDCGGGLVVFSADLPDGPRLREVAEVNLKKHVAPPTKGWPVGTDALGLLYKLASQSDSASDALKFLHELQVHQVELDLLHTELEGRQGALEHDLHRYHCAFEFAPVAYLLVAGDGVIEEANLAFAGMLDVDPSALTGQSLKSLLTEASRAALDDMLHTLGAGASRAACDVELAEGRPGTMLHMQGAAAPVDDSAYLVVVT